MISYHSIIEYSYPIHRPENYQSRYTGNFIQSKLKYLLILLFLIIYFISKGMIKDTMKIESDGFNDFIA